MQVQPGELDIVVVSNPDTECSYVDPETGADHTKYFEVRWDKYPYQVPTGGTKRLPKYIADHYLKHMIDHLLMVRGDKIGQPFLIQNKVERTNLAKQLVVSMDTPFVGTAAPVANLKEQEDLSDMETVIDDVPTTEDTQAEVKAPAIETPAPHAAEIPPGKPGENRSRGDLFKEAKELGIQTTGKETKDELIKLILEF